MATKKPNPFAKMSEKADKASDKKAGIKENSKKDMAQDAALGFKRGGMAKGKRGC